MDDFLIATGLTDGEFAEFVGYSRVTINHFRTGLYEKMAGGESNSIAVRAAIKSYIDAHPITNEVVDHGRLYQTGNYRLLKKAFFAALDRGHAYCIDGAPGTQKSFLLRRLCADLATMESQKNGRARRAVYVYCRENIQPRDLLCRICEAAGVPAKGNIDQLIKKLRFYFHGRRAILLLDEAQHLNHLCVETLRELLDCPPFFGLIFAGSHQLKQVFNSLHMEQWRSRLQQQIDLPGITEEEAEEIITTEFGKVNKKAIAEMIDKCRVADYRKPGEKYLNARSLFFSIDQVKNKFAERANAKAEGASA